MNYPYPAEKQVVTAELADPPASGGMSPVWIALGVGAVLLLLVGGLSAFALFLASSRVDQRVVVEEGPGSDLVVEVGDANFDQEVLAADVPVLVDFYADWCGPCRLQSPILHQFAAETENIKIAKVDVDANPQLAQEYNILSIPTLLVVKRGQVVARHTGLSTKETLRSLLESEEPSADGEAS